MSSSLVVAADIMSFFSEEQVSQEQQEKLTKMDVGGQLSSLTARPGLLHRQSSLSDSMIVEDLSRKSSTDDDSDYDSEVESVDSSDDDDDGEDDDDSCVACTARVSFGGSSVSGLDDGLSGKNCVSCVSLYNNKNIEKNCVTSSQQQLQQEHLQYFECDNLDDDYTSPHMCLLLVELLREIFFRLTPSSRELANLALVCKKFCNVVEDPFTWRFMTEQDFKVEIGAMATAFDWKLYYREKMSFARPLNWEVVQSEDHPSPRQSHGAGKVGNQMYVFGGHQVVDESFVRKDDIWTFNPSTNNFQQVNLEGPSSLPALSRHRMVTINSKLYSFGGILQDKTKVNTIYCFDFALGKWEIVQPESEYAPAPRCDPVVVAHDNDLIVFGGSIANMDFPSDIHIFNTVTRRWYQPSVSGDVPPPRIGCTGVVIDDSLYIYGGGDYDKVQRKYTTLYTEIWALNLKSFQWSKVNAAGNDTSVLPTIYDFLSSFVIGHHFVVIGGWCTEEPFAFDTVSRQWIKLANSAPTKINNNDSSATLIGNSVYMFGGYHNTYQHHMCKMDISHLQFLLPQ